MAVRDCQGCSAPRPVSLFLSQSTLLSPLLLRASPSLLFSLPTIHYSSSHSSLTLLCHPPPPPFPTPALNCIFSVSSPPWLSPFYCEPCLTVALSWTWAPAPPPNTHTQQLFPTAQGRAFHEQRPDLAQYLLCPGGSEPNRNRARSVPCGLGLPSPSLPLFCVSEGTALPQQTSSTRSKPCGLPDRTRNHKSGVPGTVFKGMSLSFGGRDL